MIEKAQASDRHAQSILIVEDDLALQKLIQTRLSRAGYHTAGVTSGREAMEWLASNRPSLMLLDYTLPDMRGEDLVENLAAQDRSVPFIVSTGNSSPAVAVAMMKRGAHDYLIKSADSIDLLPTVIERVLQQVQQEQQLAAAEAALRASERRYQTLVSAAPVGIVHCDADGRCLYVNEQWSTITGLAKEQAFNDSWMSTLVEEDRDRVAASWREAVVQGKPFYSEHRFRRPDGVTSWALAQALPERNAAGMVTGFVRTVTDVTQSKKVEMALAASEELNRRIFEAMPGGVVQVALDGQIVKANSQAQRLLGVSFDSDQRKFVTDFAVVTLREDGSPCPVDEYPVSQCLRTAQVQPPKTIGVRRPDGEVSWCIFTAVPVTGPADQLMGAVVTFLDITQRKEAEETLRRQKEMLQKLFDDLRESEARMRALIENLPFDFWACDASGRYVMQNATSLKHWGSFIGKRPEELDLPPDILKSWIENNRRVLSGEVIRGETQYEQDSEVRTYLSVLAPIRDGSEIRGSVGMNIDVTERKEAEEKSRQLLADLAHVTRLSTMGTMVSELTHEINQPLYAIANFAEACSNILKTTSTADQQDVVHWIGQISTQAKRAGDIVRGLGQFVRKSPVRRDEVDLNTLVHEVIDLLTVNSRMAQVPLTLDLARSLPMVRINGVQIQQVLVNLLLNATEAMESIDKAQRAMTIRTRPRGTEFVEIIVEDMGPGIGPEQMQRLFEPYYTTKPGGMGMGLVISQSIIEAHDGDLWATSEQGAGTTFHFTLPVGTEEDADELG